MSSQAHRTPRVNQIHGSDKRPCRFETCVHICPIYDALLGARDNPLVRAASGLLCARRRVLSFPSQLVPAKPSLHPEGEMTRRW